MNTRSFALGAVLALATASVTLAPAGAVEAGPWSPPAVLGSCTNNSAPQVVFPSNRPTHATGPGAIVWSASRGCAGGEGARVAPIGIGEVPAPPIIPATAAAQQIAPRGALEVSGAPHGKIVIAGRSAREHKGVLLIQGTAGGPFTVLGNIPGDHVAPALSSGYLGDMALAFPAPAGVGSEQLHVSVERFFSHQLAQRSALSSWSGSSPGALTVALDYRTDALTVWEQSGSLWAHDMPASGASHPVLRLASVQPGVRIAALLSDDNRATVAWEQERAGVSSVYLDRSAVGVRFGKPKLIERFRNPDGLHDPIGAPRLVRLSSESVMMAWAGASDGHWVVRSAAIDFTGIGAATTIAAPGADALLADLAPGPDDNALLLWTEPQQNASETDDMERQTLFSARGSDIYPDTTAFGQPEPIAPPGPYSNPTVALDPANGRAVAAWQDADGTLEYAIRSLPDGSG